MQMRSHQCSACNTEADGQSPFSCSMVLTILYPLLHKYKTRCWLTTIAVINTDSNLYQIDMTCDPKEYLASQAYFSYGDKNENGSDTNFWTAANWQKNWVGHPITVKAKSDALYYISVEYKNGETIEIYISNNSN